MIDSEIIKFQNFFLHYTKDQKNKVEALSNLNISIYCMSKKLDDIISKALENIEKDREVTRDLLNDAITYLSKDESRHRDIGMTLAKYVEVLQRSNEQMVKVASLVQKEEKTADGLSEADMENIFSMIDKEKEDDG